MKTLIYTTFGRLNLCVAFLGALAPLYSFAQEEFVFLLRAKGNPYWNTVASSIQETAQQRGITATVYQGQSESSAEEQLNTCLTSIQRRPKFLAVVAATTSVGIQCLKSAQLAGIPVAEIDSSIPLIEAKKAGVKIAFSVGSDNFEIGKKAAQYAKELLVERAARIVVLEGAVGSEPGRLRVEGFRTGIATLLPEAAIAASVSADWDRLKSMNVTTDLLERFPKIDLIFAANDLMALGAVEALKSKSRLSETRVIGVDGTSDARRAVAAGELSATIAQVPYLLGKRAVELAVDATEGRQVPEREITDTPVLTRGVLADKNSPALLYVYSISLRQRLPRLSFLRCLLFFLVLVTIFSLLSPYFLSRSNFDNILAASAVTGLLAVGSTFVIGSGGIDLSIASVMALSGTVCASIIQNSSLGPVAAFVICVCTSTMCGAVTGCLVNVTRAPTFIVTLGMLSVARATAYIVADGIPIYGLPESVTYVGQGYLWGVSLPVILFLTASLIAVFILRRSVFGIQSLLLGDNPSAADAMGINVPAIRLKVYALCGVFSGIAGFIFMARTNAGDPTAGQNYELMAITAVILGGTKLFGGRATIFGTVLGAMCLGTLQNGLNLLAVSTYYQVLFVGVVLLGAALLERFGGEV